MRSSIPWLDCITEPDYPHSDDHLIYGILDKKCVWPIRDEPYFRRKHHMRPGPYQIHRQSLSTEYYNVSFIYDPSGFKAACEQVIGFYNAI